MYLRHTTSRKDGKRHRYWRSVESVRTGRKVRQRTVAQLGELDARGQIEARRFAGLLAGNPEQSELFNDGHEDVCVPVRLKEVRVERSKKRLSRDTVNRQIGRILQQNQRAAARFAIALTDDESPAGFHVDVSIKTEFDEWAAISEGTYILRTNVTDWDDERLWKTYIQLTQAEAAFRIQKDELAIRPVWHQHTERVDAHILVCFLAFAMWKVLESWQSRSGLGNSPRSSGANGAVAQGTPSPQTAPGHPQHLATRCSANLFANLLISHNQHAHFAQVGLEFYMWVIYLNKTKPANQCQPA